MKLLHYILAPVLLFGAWSCSDKSDPELSLPPVGGDECLVSIQMPVVAFGNSSFGSRAVPNTPIDGNEGTLRSLYVMIFSYDEDNKIYHRMSCEEKIASGTTNKVTNNYDDLVYNSGVGLGIGTYKFYILANFLEYWEDDDRKNLVGDEKREAFEAATDSEEKIKDLILTYKGNIKGEELPMICLPENICIDNEDNTGQVALEHGEFTVSESDVLNQEKKTLYAPLSILCTKVRFTLLYDHTGFSSEFPANASFEINPGVDVDNVYKYFYINSLPEYQETPETGSEVIGEEPSADVNSESDIPSAVAEADDYFNILSSSATEPIMIEKTKYPSLEDGTNAYLAIKESLNVPSNLEKLGTEATWTNSEQRAWQCLTYLPANPNSEPVTTLKISTGGGAVNESYTIPLSALTEGYFYDIVAKLITPKIIAVSINVKVTDWTYNPEQSVSW
ncbi:MAG: hypothetical protein J1D77_05630 [Muribaculaceae bacterium]|nr:hypothetical protein [Muribaculaceae bacterium]